jgi:hypothetical protein
MTKTTTPEMFLNRQEIAELTGIKIGKGGKSREKLQIDVLTQMAIPFYVNAAQRPVVVRTVLQGGMPAANKPQWKSSAKAP